MSQPSLFSAKTWTVTELTRHVRTRLDSDEALQDVWIQGELSNVSRPASGHVYFTLKDASAALRCVIWRTEARRIKARLQDGEAVDAHGHISVFEAGGQYQLYVDDLRSMGEGTLFQEFVRLKAALEADGIFDPARKLPIPALPHLIGIVTSPTGAALRDVLDTLRRRLPLAEAVLSPSPVQGAEAPTSLVTAVRAAQRQNPDVILLVRGGGSIEDLWAFNDPALARTVAASPVPIICGVGHETDFTLCDFAAALRAPTPTAAAELATPVTIGDLRDSVTALQGRLVSALHDVLLTGRSLIQSLAYTLGLLSPARRLESERQRHDELSRRVSLALTHDLGLRTVALRGLMQRVNALSPAAVLERGFAIVSRTSDGRLVTKVAQASGHMQVRVSDGEFRVHKN
jgi:exodeoxyribonuclease VII large subunit